MSSREPWGLKGKAIKDKIAAGEPVVCIGLWFPDPLIGELLTMFPIDVFFVDLEHAPWEIASIQQLLSVTRNDPVAVVVRPGNVDQAKIQLLLDLGVDGIAISHCDTLATTRQAIDAAKYPPIGRRGIGPTRASRYLTDIDSYLQQANDAVFLWLQVERDVPQKELAQMLDQPGVDALLVGPCDIASALSQTACMDHPGVNRVIRQTVEVARDKNIPFGVPGAAPGDYPGQMIFLQASDVEALKQGAARLLNASPTNAPVKTTC
jgi:2-keto-3-deoxy-L-rhamnonate aldolase RhmA